MSGLNPYVKQRQKERRDELEAMTAIDKERNESLKRIVEVLEELLNLSRNQVSTD